jgi:hypothetical protein
VFFFLDFLFLREVCMTKKKDLEKPKPPPKIAKAQGLVLPGRSTFIDDIIRKAEYQSLVGPRKGSTRIP